MARVRDELERESPFFRVPPPVHTPRVRPIPRLPPNLTRQRSDDDATLGTRPAVDPNPHALDATD
jgi:hypothetical protein